jgi:hypothetical protein
LITIPPPPSCDVQKLWPSSTLSKPRFSSLRLHLIAHVAGYWVRTSLSVFKFKLLENQSWEAKCFRSLTRACVCEYISEWRMPSSGMWRCADLVWTDVWEDRRLTQDLHSATSQKTAFFIVTAVKTSNLTNYRMIVRGDGRSRKANLALASGRIDTGNVKFSLCLTN